MAELHGVPPGRAGRLWLEARLGAGRRAADLLDDKLHLLHGEQARFRLLEERTGTRWRSAWREADRWGLRAAFLAGGRELGLSAPTRPAEVTVSWDSLMGLRYPVAAACPVPDPSTGERGPGSAALVEAAAAVRDALSAAAEHAAAVAARRIIDAEVAATRRRLRAITHRWLPQLENALRRLTHDLDETEQAETFRLRWAAVQGTDGRARTEEWIPMIENILVAVDDTSAALAGARLAIDLADAVSATVHAIAVVPDAGAGSNADLAARLEQNASAVLAHVARKAQQANVSIQTTLRRGDPAPCILDRAREVGADLVVVGRSGRPGPGQPFIGSQTRRILEFAESPVIVVPEAGRT